MATLSNTRQRRPSATTNGPTTRAAEWTRRPADDARRAENAPTCFATTAAGACRPAGMAAGDTVATPANSAPPANDAPSACLSASPDTAAIRLPIPNVSADKSQLCEHCGRPFAPRRPWGRFCSAYCRRLAWLGRNPERAAELAERDKARYRAHVIGNGGTWAEVH